MSDARPALPAPREKRAHEGRHALRRVLLMPLIAIPLAVFFGMIFGDGSWSSILSAYTIALPFSLGVVFAQIAMERFILPRLVTESGPGGKGWMVETGAYTVASMIGAAAGAVFVDRFIFPGFLGGPRQVAVVGMFALLFAVLFGGIALAITFYRQALGRARAEQELQTARRIQRAFLLSQFPLLPGLEVHALNLSSREVSGDVYDVVADGQDAYLAVIADVSGKGVPAALLSSMLQAALRALAGKGMQPAEIVSAINRLVCDRTTPEQFATFFLARVDAANLSLEYVNAGHNAPYLFRADGTRRALEAGGTVLGFLPDAPYGSETIQLARGDMLLCYTDGLSEAEAPSGEMFGEERIERLLATLPEGLPAREIIDRVLHGLRGHLSGREAGDDVTLLALRVTADRAADVTPALDAGPGPNPALPPAARD